tara:strand:- start:1245 stop:1520 length:276 start_codon:yes stop_codon:yes gene_type:complete
MEISPLADKKAFIAELAELHHAVWKHLNPSLTLEGRPESIAEAAGRGYSFDLYCSVQSACWLGGSGTERHGHQTGFNALAVFIWSDATIGA